MLRLTLFLSMLAATAYALSPPPPDSDAPEVLLGYIRFDEFLSQHVNLDGDAGFGFPDPRAVFKARDGVAEPWPAVVARLGRDLHLPADAAEPLARALVRWVAFSLEFRRAPVDLIESDLELAIRNSRAAFEAVSCAHRFFQADGSASKTRRFVALLERVTADVPGLPMTVTRLPTPRIETLLFAFEKDSATLIPILENFGGWGDPALLPLLDAGLAKLLPHPTPEKAPLTALVATGKLNALFGAGLASDAVAFFESLPQPIRQAMLTAAEPKASKGDQGQRALLEELATAFVLTGNRAMAASLVRRLHPQRPSPLLEAALFPARDPFETLARARPSDLLGHALTLRVAATYLVFRRRLLAYLTELRTNSLDDVPLERTVRALAPVKAKQEAMKAAWALEFASLKTPAATEAEDPSAKTIAQLLAAPLRPACVERPGPAEQPKKQEPFAFAWPKRGDPVAWARRGVEIFAVVYAGDDEDPAGERSLSHWLTRSSDGGKTWTPRRDMGLHLSVLPYKFKPADIVDGHLVFTAEVQPNQGDVEREPTTQVVTCNLAELDRDTDGDGLTDLLEARLVTDPESRDTDGDGLEDATDPMPHVSVKGTPTLLGTLAIRLHASTNESHVALEAPRRTRQVESLSTTHFVTGDRRGLGGLTPASRMIVLTADEVRRLSEKFPGFESTWLPFIAMNHTKTTALVIWSSNRGGRTCLLHKEKDGWRVEVLSWWMV